MANKKRAETSRHFSQIWEKVIRPVLTNVRDECDLMFVERCALQNASDSSWKQELYEEYLRIRDRLKNTCYGPHGQYGAEELLDGRKMAAVLCGALIRRKGFLFDSGAAEILAAEKKKEMRSQLGSRAGSVRFNIWATQNVYINYKLAYYASLQMVYLTLMRDLLEASKLAKNEGDLARCNDVKELVAALNRIGHLSRYPQPKKGDGFDVNIIIGLARMDITGKELDTFMFAMQLYQIEEYTIDKLTTKR